MLIKYFKRFENISYGRCDIDHYRIVLTNNYIVDTDALNPNTIVLKLILLTRTNLSNNDIFRTAFWFRVLHCVHSVQTLIVRAILNVLKKKKKSTSDYNQYPEGFSSNV